MSGPHSSASGADDPAPALTARFYAELRAIAHRAFARERGGHTLDPTAAVNEACLRILSSSPLPDVPREQRLALASRVLRQVLVDHHRHRMADRREGTRTRISLESADLLERAPRVDLEAIEEALVRLRELHPRQADVVELRVFGGLGMEEIAAALNAARRTVEADWTVARAWLRRALDRDLAEGA